MVVFLNAMQGPHGFAVVTDVYEYTELTHACDKHACLIRKANRVWHWKCGAKEASRKASGLSDYC